jgi:hypothetical protein
MVVRRWVVILGIAALVAGCGSGGTQQSSGQPAGGAGTGAPATGAGTTGGDCPLTEAEAAAATSLSWKLATTQKDRPLETMESVKVTACVYTTAELRQSDGDPLVLRVDVVNPKDAEAVRADVDASCTRQGGTRRAAEGGAVCDRDGVVVDGYTGNLVLVLLVSPDTDIATKLTPSFEKVLAAAR